MSVGPKVLPLALCPSSCWAPLSLSSISFSLSLIYSGLLCQHLRRLFNFYINLISFFFSTSIYTFSCFFFFRIERMIATSTMNRASLHSSILDGNSTEMTVLERQQWQHQRKQNYFEDTHFNVSQFPSSLINNELKIDPNFENGGLGLASDMNCAISRTFSCPPVVGLTEKSFKKRKAEKSFGAEDTNDKRIKGEVEEVACKIPEQTNNNNKNNHKRETSAAEVQKTDYIHVRARRGQATDSHSLAERVRREKISERMRYLQDLVPGCNKIIGKAGMLDEIINYVQSLQSQVEFLSMKLANVNPRIDRNIDNFLANEMFQSCADSFPTVGMLSEVISPPYYQFNPVQQVVSCGGLGMEINHTEMSLERTTSSPVSIADEFLDSSGFSQAQPPAWDDLQNLYNIGLRRQERSTAFPSESFTGNQTATNLKMEI